jgi:hypothetical protein
MKYVASSPPVQLTVNELCVISDTKFINGAVGGWIDMALYNMYCDNIKDKNS